MIQQVSGEQTLLQRVISDISAWFQAHPLTETVVGLVLLALVAYLANVVAKRRLVKLVNRLLRKTSVKWDDAIEQQRVFDRLAHIVPAVIVYFGIGLVPRVSADVALVIRNVATGYMVLVMILTLGAALTAAGVIYETFPISKSRPIKGYLQVAKIAIYVVGGVLIVAALLDKSPLLFLSGIGALTAVILLVFKDTILSLVAGIQLTSTDMVRVGDWIEMPKYGADGDVTDIALYTVTVQNFDNTITRIPTSTLMSDSFKNWRGMSESGGRRIKRAFYVDMNTVRALTDDEVERFKRFVLLQDYIEAKQADLAEYNAQFADQEDTTVNLRRLTNIGMLRAYIINYLRHHPKIHKGMTQLVRQLDPTPDGVPIEIYVFTNTTEWIAYEGIQSDIFDHFMAIMPEFGLRVFQHPSGADFQELVPSRK